MKQIAKIEESTLVIATRMAKAERANVAVLDLVLITRRRAKCRKHVTRLRVQAAAIIFVINIRIGKITSNCRNRGGRERGARWISDVEEVRQPIGAELTIVGFGTADFVAPAWARGKVPAGTGAEEVQCVALVQIGWQERRLAGDARIAVVFAQRHANLVGIAKAVAKIARKRAVQKTVVRSLALSLEVRCRKRIVECAQQAADLAAATPRGKTATFAEETEFRSACCAAMRENLDDASQRVGSIKSALGATHDFHLVNVVQGEIGEIDGVPWFIHGCTIN